MATPRKRPTPGTPAVLAKPVPSTGPTTAAGAAKPQELVDLQQVAAALQAARRLEATKQGAVSRTEERLDKAQQDLEAARKALADAREKVPKLEAQVDELLDKLTDRYLELGPGIEIFRGGSMTLKAKHKEPLPPELKLEWDAGPMPIVSGQHTDTVVIDTSNVDEGDYEVAVSVALV